MVAKETRHNLATEVQGDLGGRWTVYPNPPDNLSIPCVVLGPRSPYRVTDTYTGDRLNLTATITLPSTGVLRDTFDALDDTVETVLASLLDAGAEVQQVTNVGLTETDTEGRSYIVATIDLTVFVDR